MSKGFFHSTRAEGADRVIGSESRPCSAALPCARHTRAGKPVPRTFFVLRLPRPPWPCVTIPGTADTAVGHEDRIAAWALVIGSSLGIASLGIGHSRGV